MILRTLLLLAVSATPIFAQDDIDYRIGARVPVEVEPLFERGSKFCLLYTSPSPRDRTRSRMPSSA